MTGWVYCRRCSRAVRVDETTKTEYIEKSIEDGISRHFKRDCDKIYPDLKPSQNPEHHRKG